MAKKKHRRATSERFYLSQDITNPITRAYWRVIKHKKPVPAFPKIIQIQTQSGCNAACAFCPNKKTIKTLPQGKMQEDLFCKIIDEVVQYVPKRISPYLMNEPLLDPDLPDRIGYIAERKRPTTKVAINTNASKLDKDMARELLRCGLDAMAISFHGLTKDVYETGMVGLSFDENLERVNIFLEMWRTALDPKPDVHITMVNTKLIEPQIPQIHEYWNARGVKAQIRPLSNRAHVAVDQCRMNPEDWEPFVWCKELIRQAFIVFTGDAVLCCADWERSTVLGNLRKQTLYEIWNGKKAVDIRRRYFSGHTKGLLCGHCKRVERR
jgi:MoaA/NifB/PqqE/SkfB family radical SAM enzyme